VAAGLTGGLEVFAEGKLRDGFGKEDE